MIDFSTFFDRVNHETLFTMIDKEISDIRLRRLIRCFVSVFGDGVSLGLGSQVSPVAAVFYPSRLDHFIKERLRIKYYGRYMDDLYLIHQDREYLKYCLAEIRAICASLAPRLNEKKTRIVKLSSGVSFLKGRYTLTESCRILRLPCKDSTARMRRKLKKFKALIEAGNMDVQDLRIAYQSWRGNYMKRFKGYYRIRRMDTRYNELFISDKAGNNGQTSGCIRH
jgi:retron-type reverse transcriptase